MNYNKINLKNYNLDSDFLSYIESFQNIYEHKVLQITPSTNTAEAIALEAKENVFTENTVVTATVEKRDIKKILEDFFFTPKYNNVLDVLKFGNN
ncbi:hypothetical protein [Tenacibaculum finnmarkense]|uniref:hypothetical protein n=1 Tax=Tenacibaculum finnmarkense TaxID=2781243 RepID=UPI00187B17F2|nr:hypothetical protein [Tenacibaculum finnmarkense]MBE7659459.1 hypothetical protein [Tenacibaculum finnmarkense genomovar finnmarkense]MBE7692185.1 hypothetical protein [Tenacibaculum finnmarkense genomovar finnmarkense]MCD8446572.1 hypothetical protein [Tenacibaculum finnmarkense genomovar finnmarkense]MCD8453598.1 hypothetical protein [Tenacibaculum finnmarkense genomovar ulcerans]MCG8250978.1 hypothetical protein [Tenacibaculum finnmarkense genomovar finnmarkense]